MDLGTRVRHLIALFIPDGLTLFATRRQKEQKMHLHLSDALINIRSLWQRLHFSRCQILEALFTGLEGNRGTNNLDLLLSLESLSLNFLDKL